MINLSLGYYVTFKFKIEQRASFELLYLALVTSSKAPIVSKIALASLVWLTLFNASDTTSGNSGTLSILWPLAWTNAGSADAAKADETAYLRWFTLIFRCHLLQIFVGPNILPPLHIFPKAPCPEREVPPPGTRGIRATARPVPQDSAGV